VASLGRLNTSADSQVLSDTLNVIDEHITDLRSPPSNGALHAATDSGSEYSAQLEHRMSYIQGEETDEEEDGTHTRLEVESWSADEVAEYLFTAGVEKQHCEVFRDQEITGEVLLGMDQSSIFIKAFDLGSVGRRLKTWQKIKSLQDEVNTQAPTRRTTQTYGSEAGSAGGRTRSRTNTITSAAASQRPDDRSSVQGKRRSLTMTPKAEPVALGSPISPTNLQGSPTHAKRPSAASVRELHHSRRHSSNDFRLTGTTMMSGATPKLATSGTFPQANNDVPHKKQPSFDRNWTMGSAYTPRPLSSTGFQEILAQSEMQDSAVDLDRGYFSGTDVDGRRKNVLRKSGSHSKQNSYTEEQRVRSATAISRHSRYGSVDSVREGGPPSAAQKYYGRSGPHRRTASTNTTESIRPIPPAKDNPSPTVTKLEAKASPRESPTVSPLTAAGRHGFHADWLAAMVNKPMVKSGLGIRATSDSTAGDRNKALSPTDSSVKDSPIQSPSRTGSSTPSAGPSLDLDDNKSPGGAGAAGRKARQKNKKETSAYTRGLQKMSPKEAMKDADYSGWMKKKSSNLMTTWKPRLFILKGRRLAYYYSEDDDQEKGLIDISFHRVLPADNERLTGLHAQLTGAGNTPTMPSGHFPGDNSTSLAKGDDTMFIFKLVPPRAGLSRAVNFTKPMVHYFAVPNLKQGRLWMAALMKATIDRDDAQPITTTYQQKTISLAKARAMRHRPPALMNLDEGDSDEEKRQSGASSKKGRGDGLGLVPPFGEADSGVSGLEKLGLAKVESAKAAEFPGAERGLLPPQSA